MYKKYLIVASKRDKAGINITTQLSQFQQNPVLLSMKNAPAFDFYLTEGEIIFTENLDLEKINKYDFVIFASKHSTLQTETRKTLSIHAPGNWLNTMPKFGGESEKLCKTSALFQKQLFIKLNNFAKEHDLNDYNVTMECTHHGPLIEKPCLFIEIGSTENEWQDRKTGFVVAKTISHVINEFTESSYNEIAIAVGGKHYCQSFNKIQLNSNVAISHLIPQYIFPLKEEMITEAIRKTEEEVDFILVDWKGLGKSEQRKEVLKILDRFRIQCRRTSKIDK